MEPPVTVRPTVWGLSLAAPTLASDVVTVASATPTPPALLASEVEVVLPMDSALKVPLISMQAPVTVAETASQVEDWEIIEPTVARPRLMGNAALAKDSVTDLARAVKLPATVIRFSPTPLTVRVFRVAVAAVALLALAPSREMFVPAVEPVWASALPKSPSRRISERIYTSPPMSSWPP